MAAIETSDFIFYASYQPQPQEPHSAVTELIQGIHQLYPQNALRLLRQPLILNYTPSLLCRGMISIVAKRFRIDPSFFQNETTKVIQRIQYQNFLKSSCSATTSTLELLNIKDWIQTPPTIVQVPHKKVRAALVSSTNNQVILTTEDFKETNKTLHAEVVLLQNYFALKQQGFTEPHTLMTNLQSCKMCAAMFWHMHTNPWKNLKAIYAYPELGPSARDTILSRGGNWRRSFAQNSEELYKTLEFPL